MIQWKFFKMNDSQIWIILNKYDFLWWRWNSNYIMLQALPRSCRLSDSRDRKWMKPLEVKWKWPAGRNVGAPMIAPSTPMYTFTGNELSLNNKDKCQCLVLNVFRTQNECGSVLGEIKCRQVHSTWRSHGRTRRGPRTNEAGWKCENYAVNTTQTAQTEPGIAHSSS